MRRLGSAERTDDESVGARDPACFIVGQRGFKAGCAIERTTQCQATDTGSSNGDHGMHVSSLR
jgi:hypothetical protein